MSGTIKVDMVILFGHELRAASAALARTRNSKRKEVGDDKYAELIEEAYRLAEIALYGIIPGQHIAVLELSEEDIAGQVGTRPPQ